MTVCDVGTVWWMGLKVLWLPHAPESPSHSLRALCLPPLTSQQPPPLLAAYRPTMSYRTWRHPYLLPPSSNISVETPKTPVVSLVSYLLYWNTLWNYLVYTGCFWSGPPLGSQKQKICRKIFRGTFPNFLLILIMLFEIVKFDCHFSIYRPTLIFFTKTLSLYFVRDWGYLKTYFGVFLKTKRINATTTEKS